MIEGKDGQDKGARRGMVSKETLLSFLFVQNERRAVREKQGAEAEGTESRILGIKRGFVREQMKRRR